MGESEDRSKLIEHQRASGRVGGSARTDAKRAASKANLALARVKRWKGREAAAELALHPIIAEPQLNEAEEYNKWLSQPVGSVDEALQLANAFASAWNNRQRGQTIEDIQAAANRNLDRYLQGVKEEHGPLREHIQIPSAEAGSDPQIREDSGSRASLRQGAAGGNPRLRGPDSSDS